jgi:glucose-1-phosphatase
MNTFSGIRNIIFDLGGVVLNIDYHATEQAFIKLGVTGFPELYSQAKQDHLFDRFETGEMKADEFRNKIRELSQLNLSDAEIDDAWNAMLGDIPEIRIRVIQSLQRNYRLFLLSNTNTIHAEAFMAYISETYGSGLLSSLFEQVYLSCNMGCRKPDAEIFHRVLMENHLNPSETLFIDDTERHVLGAAKCGLKTIYLTSDKTLETVFGEQTI